MAVILALAPREALPDHLFPDPVYALPGADSYSLIAPDLNGDGLPDLVRASYGGVIAVGTSVKRGVFSPAVVYTVGSGTAAVAAGDLDGDGDLDLAAAGTVASNLTVLLNDGHGAFQVMPPVPSSNPEGIVIADFSGDTINDVVVASFPVMLYVGRGDGTFVATVDLGTAPPGQLVAADFNHDGRMDIASAGYLSASVGVLLNTGSAPFTSFEISTVHNPWDLEVADFNHDGHLDVATANYEASASVFLGLGDGTFQPGTMYPTSSFSSLAISIGDYNDDGHPDLISQGIGVSFEQTLSLFLGRGDGTFLPRRAIRGPGGFAFASADFNLDGHPDLAMPFLEEMEFLYGRGDGTFGPESQLVRTPLPPGGFDFGDIDSDGDDDLVLALRGEYPASLGGIGIYLSDGQGNYTQAAGLLVESNPRDLSLADLDRDGRLDLVSINPGVGFCASPPPLPCVPIFIFPGDMRIFRGAGHGLFEESGRLDTGRSHAGLVVRDMDADGIDDIVTSRSVSSSSAQITFRRGRGDGSFDPVVAIGVGPRVVELDSADLNADGLPDLIGAHSSAPTISIRLNEGGGSFDASNLFTRGVRDVSTGDFNHDGRIDLTFVDGVDQTWIHAGRGDGTFEDFSRVAPSTPGGSVAVGDFDGDGLDDVASADLSGLGVYLSAGSLEFRDPLAFRHPQTSRLVPRDVDGNGRLDLVAAVTEGILIVLNQLRPPNAPPVAVASAPSTSECGSGVTLDASLSTDPDSAAGTQDDIAVYEWTELTDSGEIPLGTGVQLEVVLSKGHHVVVLRVTDEAGESATAMVEIDVRDTTAPEVSLSAAPGILWPPDHRMVWVDPQVTAADLCGAAVTTLSVTSSEPEDGVGDGDGKTAPDIVMGPGPMISLRAERDGEGSGRIYTIVATATDEEGLTSSARSQVVVPHDRGKNGPRP